MEKLTPTSYVRMVDAWLIFGQLIPFVEVSLLTIIELYNDGMDRVNHHGRAINTKSTVSILQMNWTLCYCSFVRAYKLFHKHLPGQELNWMEMRNSTGTRLTMKSILKIENLMLPSRLFSCWPNLLLSWGNQHKSSNTYLEIQTLQNGPKPQVFAKVLLQNVIHDIIEKKIVPTLVFTFFCVYWTFGICC